METGLYVKYAQQFPDGPKSAEALYNAVYRQGVVVTMYSGGGPKKVGCGGAEGAGARAGDEDAVSEVGLRGAGGEYCVSGVAGDCGVWE